MKYDIFISYSRKDIEKVRPVIDELQARDFSIWFDLSNIDYTETFPDRIAEALDNSDSLLFICTPNSLKANYCKKEIGYARNNNLKVRAILLGGSMPRQGWFALEYQDVNCVNITKYEQKVKFYEELESVYQPHKAVEREIKIREAKDAMRKKVREEEEKKIKEAEQKAKEEELARLHKEKEKRIRRKKIYWRLLNIIKVIRSLILQFLIIIKKIGTLGMVYKIKKHILSPFAYISILLVTFILCGVYTWRNKYDLFPSFFSLEERLGYTEVGENVDGYRLVKTNGGKYAFIQAEEPWNLCTDTIYTEFTEMKDSIAWLKDSQTLTWKCFYAGEIRDISYYTKIIEPTNDSVSFFLFNKEILHKHFLSNPEFNDLTQKLKDINKQNQKQSTRTSPTNVSPIQNHKALIDSLSKEISQYSNLYIPSFKDTLSIDSLRLHYGILNKEGEVIIPPIIDRIEEYTTLYAVARFNDLWGLVLYHTHQLPQFEFENKFSYASRNYAEVKRNDKWGLIDQRNKIIIKIENDSIGYDFYNDLIRVKYEGLWGFKDKNDKYIIKPLYKEANDFHFGYAAVKDYKTNKWLYINKENKTLPISINGLTITEPYFDIAYNFYRQWYNENDTVILAKIKKEKAIGFIRLFSNFASQFTICEYEDLVTLKTKGFFKYKTNEKFGFWYNSSKITSPIYDEITFNYSSSVYETKLNKKIGVVKLVNGNVNIIIPTDYEELKYALHNCYIVKKNTNWGLFNVSNHKEVIPCNYYQIVQNTENYNYCIIKKQINSSIAEGLYSIKEKKEILHCIYSYIIYDGKSNLIEVWKNFDERGIYDLKANRWLGKGPVYTSVHKSSNRIGLCDKDYKYTYYEIKK